ncbi:hypothetical protein HDU92_006434 [Lobulomyces angularis]|nr:hypothetical protein HDU92_006434 [Lobulomyces angularis]
MSILNFGSINIDEVYSVDHICLAGETIHSTNFKVTEGGKGANQSVALSLSGQKVYHFGKVGKDGNFVLQKISSEFKVDTTFAEVLQNEYTGKAIIQKDKLGENCIILFAGANQLFSEIQFKTLFDKLPNCVTWCCLQNECNLGEIFIEHASKKGLIIVFNPAPCTANLLETYNLNLINVLITNEIESATIFSQLNLENKFENFETNDLIKLVLNTFMNLRIFCITLGAKGSVCGYKKGHNDDLEILKIGGLDDVNVKDTVGAGDTFVGFFVGTLMKENKDLFTLTTKKIKKSLLFGTIASAMACEKEGSLSSIPFLNSVEERMANSTLPTLSE